MMADTAKIKRNIQRMIDQGAPEADIDAYVASEKTTPEALRTAPGNGATEISQAGGQPAASTDMSWANVGQQAVENLPQSAANFGKAMIQPVMHPLQTVDDVGALMSGGLGHAWNAVMPSSMDMTPGRDMNMASALADFYRTRYGSVSGFKNAVATDPVGIAADIATVLTGGAGAATKIGLPSRIANSVNRVADLVNPLTPVVKGAQLTGKAMGATAKAILGASTGTGMDTIREAVMAGRMGGRYGQAFKENLRGQVEQTDVIDQAKQALGNIANTRSAAYKKGMAQLEDAAQPVPFQPIVEHYQDIVKSLSQGGMRVASDQTMKKAGEIGKVLKEWAANPSAHNALGFDALKRRIDSLMPPAISDDAANSARIVMSMRNAVKDEIVQHVPAYADTMKNYERSISAQKEIERSLSLKRSNTADTALRKLQSITRNNANTNYGSRVTSAQTLADAGAPNLMPALAGQALNTILPRGLMGPALTTAGIVSGAFLNPAFLAGSLAASPRLVGEAAYLAGALRRSASKIPRPTKEQLLLLRGLGVVSNPE